MKNQSWIIIAFVFTLIIGYLIIGIFNRYQNDDFGLNIRIQEMGGVINAFHFFLINWESNLSTLFLLFLIQFFNSWNPFLYNALILLLNVLSLNYFLRKTILNALASKYISLLLSFLIIGLLYFSCRAQGNAVYWVTGQIAYCLPLCYLFLGIAFWRENKIFLSSIFLFLFAHSRIHYDGIFLAILFIYLIYLFYSKKIKDISFAQNIPLLSFIAGTLTYIIVPGNYARVASVNSNLDPNGFVEIMSLFISAIKHYIYSFITNWRQLIIFPIGIILGYLFFEISKKITKQMLFWLTLGFIAAFLAQSIVMFIAIKTFVGYGRIFLLLDFLVVLLLLAYGVYMGSYLKQWFSSKTNSILVLSFSISIISVLFIHYYNAIDQARLFAKSYDTRMELLLAQKSAGRSMPLYLKPLNPSDVLNFMEIRPYKGNENNNDIYDNIVYEQYFNLPFKIFLEAE